ncbi:kinase-like protein [Gonapodya prolifera JEL478]|uniref:Kinase-like protein n=1 Tax=Gonapodya prolifera (strain JEL478) TaxID=1344416 RepID=A0A139AXF7_GONPJ|nr:kinase-like protein [Gonapodya prolifera JEL478]|eukprot:KXS21431.1 kinase-like protein [Gonapodya prolifera JEL478]
MALRNGAGCLIPAINSLKEAAAALLWSFPDQSLHPEQFSQTVPETHDTDGLIGDAEHFYESDALDDDQKDEVPGSRFPPLVGSEQEDVETVFRRLQAVAAQMVGKTERLTRERRIFDSNLRDFDSEETRLQREVQVVTFPNIQITKTLGEGTYGTVSEGFVPYSGILCIGVRQAVIREISVLRHLNHPNVVNLLAIHQQNALKHEEQLKGTLRRLRMGKRLKQSAKQPCIDPGLDIVEVYEFVEWDLERLLRLHAAKGVPLPFSIVRSIAVQLMDGLTFLHKHNVLHRDVKPANILLTPEGRLKLGDFGLSRYGHLLACPKERESLWEDGEVASPWYRPPEMLIDGWGGEYGEGCDLWAAGCVLAELAFGFALFSRHPPAHRAKAIRLFDSSLTVADSPTEATVPRSVSETAVPDYCTDESELEDELASALGSQPVTVPSSTPCGTQSYQTPTPVVGRTSLCSEGSSSISISNVELQGQSSDSTSPSEAIAVLDSLEDPFGRPVRTTQVQRMVAVLGKPNGLPYRPPSYLHPLVKSLPLAHPDATSLPALLFQRFRTEAPVVQSDHQHPMVEDLLSAIELRRMARDVDTGDLVFLESLLGGLLSWDPNGRGNAEMWAAEMRRMGWDRECTAIQSPASRNLVSVPIIRPGTASAPPRPLRNGKALETDPWELPRVGDKTGKRKREAVEGDKEKRRKV